MSGPKKCRLRWFLIANLDKFVCIKNIKMKVVVRTLVFIYQWLVFVPVLIVLTLITALTVMIFSPIFGNKFWGYYPPKWWSKLVCWFALCRIKSFGHENLNPKQSYVFVANHQGAFDIFLVYGFLNQNIKWVQKQSLRRIPFVGKASEIAGHVFVDNSSPKARARTILEVKKQIVDGVSVMMFPEGSRTKTGKLGRFHKGAFQIAIDLKLPIVPLTINGSYDVLSVNSLLIRPGKLELIIHQPISTQNLTEEDIPSLMEQTEEIIAAGLWPKYK